MRDPIGGSAYLSNRRIHKPLGILIYLLTKAKLYFLHDVEKLDNVMLPNLSFDLRFVFVAYIALLIIFWTLLNVMFINKPGRYRHKTMKDNTGFFNTAQKTIHNRLLDLRTDGTVGNYLILA